VPEPRKKVIALKYDPSNQSAPKLLAKGQGNVADRILAIAVEKGIPLYRDPELLEVLSQLDVGAEIQPELYQAVAEVLIYIYKMNRKRAGQRKPQSLKMGARR
jgi:flagellar biosynthesis protein